MANFDAANIIKIREWFQDYIDYEKINYSFDLKDEIYNTEDKEYCHRPQFEMAMNIMIDYFNNLPPNNSLRELYDLMPNNKYGRINGVIYNNILDIIDDHKDYIVINNGENYFDCDNLNDTIFNKSESDNLIELEIVIIIIYKLLKKFNTNRIKSAKY